MLASDRGRQFLKPLLCVGARGSLAQAGRVAHAEVCWLRSWPFVLSCQRSSDTIDLFGKLALASGEEASRRPAQDVGMAATVCSSLGKLVVSLGLCGLLWGMENPCVMTPSVEGSVCTSGAWSGVSSGTWCG